MKEGDKTKHCTMMINPSSRVKIQEDVFELVYDYLKILQNDIQMNVHKKNSDSDILNQLNDYNSELLLKKPEGKSYPSWRDLKIHLIDASYSIIVKVVNQSSGLDYTKHVQEGLSVITVGGLLYQEDLL